MTRASLNVWAELKMYKASPDAGLSERAPAACHDSEHMRALRGNRR
jgi:hypothetical protein